MKYFNYILILIGAFTAFYANNEKPKHELILIIGIVLIMIGIYRISKTIPSKGIYEEDIDKKQNN